MAREKTYRIRCSCFKLTTRVWIVALPQIGGKVFSERIARARARLGVYRKYPKKPSNWEKACVHKVPLFPPRSRSVLGTTDLAKVDRGQAALRNARLRGRDQRIPSGSSSSPSYTIADAKNIVRVCPNKMTFRRKHYMVTLS